MAACKPRLSASQSHQRVSHDSIVLCSSPLLGADGMMKAAKQFIDGVQQIEGLEVVGQPEMSVIAFKATRAAAKKCVAQGVGAGPWGSQIRARCLLCCCVCTTLMRTESPCLSRGLAFARSAPAFA